MGENENASLATTLNIPFVAIRTPSTTSQRSSSINSELSRRIFPSESDRRPSSSSHSRSSVRKTVKEFFRTSKTIDNMSTALIYGNHLSATTVKSNRHLLRLKSSLPLIHTHLSHSQPIVTEPFNSSLIDHSEQTPLLERSTEPKRPTLLKISFDASHGDTPDNGLHQQELDSPLNLEGLHRSRSCTDGITREVDVTHRTVIMTPVVLNLQPNNSEGTSLRSSDSTASSLSAYLPSQQPTNHQLTTQLIHGTMKVELNRSQESLFSFSSPLHKQRSFKSLILAATTKDQTTKQGNDVLFLIASWVFRSPEDFHGMSRQRERIHSILMDYECAAIS